MHLGSLVGGAEIGAAVLITAALIYQRVRSTSRNLWREEYEAQKAQADRLAVNVESLISEVRGLRDQNSALRAEVRELRTENRELRDHIDNILGGSG